MIDYRVGDTRDLTAELPDDSVHLVASSPPFVALRSYLPADHPDKHREIGLEPDPATFLDTLLALTAEWGRVLAPWGSIAIELGDTYSGSTMTGGDDAGSARYPGGRSSVQETYAPKRNGAAWPRAKCLALVPQAYALSLAYGRNILTGQPSPAGQWLVRNMVVWHRPNPAVGALGDKYRPSTSYITVATRSSSRWFDLTAVRTEHKTDPTKYTGNGYSKGLPMGDGDPIMQGNPAGAPPLDCWFDEHDTWTITTQPSRLAHYAMWPPKLAERLVLSMCPEWVCRVCGQPRRRVVAATYTSHGNNIEGEHRMARGVAANGTSILGVDESFKYGRATKNVETLGWSSCGHDDYGPGVVLDPFAGTGTTLAVADLHNRTGIGFDIDPRNADLVPARRAEVARALFGTRPELPGQLELL